MAIQFLPYDDLVELLKEAYNLIDPWQPADVPRCEELQAKIRYAVCGPTVPPTQSDIAWAKEELRKHDHGKKQEKGA